MFQKPGSLDPGGGERKGAGEEGEGLKSGSMVNCTSNTLEQDSVACESLNDPFY